MGGHYDKDIFKQLQEVLERSDRIENQIRENKAEHKLELKQQEIKLKEEFNEERNRFNVRISNLETELAVVKTENVLLHNDNERMKRILNNDSSNSSLPPSTDVKGKGANTYNTREKSGKKCGGQIGHKGTTLTKLEVKNKIDNGDFQHKVVSIGKQKGDYVSRYVIDLQILPTATELRFYADESGKIVIPKEYQSDVIYGPLIKSIAVDLYSEGAVSNDRICEFINAISGDKLKLSVGRYTSYILAGALVLGSVARLNCNKVYEEISEIKKSVGDNILKVIIETCYLTKTEKIKQCEIITAAGADYIKTSTGFGTDGATIEDIHLFKAHIGSNVKIKAAGGVKTLGDLELFYFYISLFG